MEILLPPDPYVALGIHKDATENDVKSAYRRLALKCHPDKFPDAAIKKVKEEEFHKILQAYELLTDPEKKSQWEIDVTLAEMKAKANTRGSGHSTRHDAPVGVYKTRECTPNFATAPPMPQERYTSYEDDDNNYKQRKSSKQHYERPSVRAEKVSTRAATDKKRAEQKKSSDKAKRSDRLDRTHERTKVDSSDSDGNTKTKRSYYEDDYTRSYEDKLRNAEDQIRRDSASDRRKAEKSRDARDMDYSRDRDRHNVYAAREHVSRGETERPSPQRTSSSRHEVRGEKPATARRSQAPPRDRAHGSYRTTIVEEPEEMDYDIRRRMPSMTTATSSTAALRAQAQEPTTRSYSYHYPSAHDASPKVSLNRSETMPVHASSSRRREAPQSSKHHHEDSGYSSPGTPPMPYPQSSYPRVPHSSATVPNAGVRYVSKDDYSRSSQNPNVVTREPGTTSTARYTTVSPKRRSSERERSPMPSSRPIFTEPQFTAPPLTRSSTYAYTDKTSSRPSMAPHAASSQATPYIVEEVPDRERGRGCDRNLVYGELPSDYHHSPKVVRPSHERKASYRLSPDNISYSKRYNETDVRYRGKEGQTDDYRRGFEDAKRELLAEQMKMASGGQDRHGPMPSLSRRGTAPVF